MSADPMTLVRTRRPDIGGFWFQDFGGGPLTFADAHLERGSTVYTAWPVLDRFQAYIVTRGIDAVLNAAAASRDRLDRVFRTLHGKGREAAPILPSRWFDRLASVASISGGSPFSAYFGNEAALASDRSRGGLVIDDSTSTQRIDGFPTQTSEGRPGHGPGGGMLRTLTSEASGGGNGGHGTSGGSDYYHGRAVSKYLCLGALETGEFNRDTIGMGGSGASSADDAESASMGVGWARGGAGGDGEVYISRQDIQESRTLDLTGSPPTNAGSSSRFFQAGNGSGGFYGAISRRGFTLANEASIDLRNGGNSATLGNGRLTTFTVNQPVINGTVTGGVITHFQIYPSVPFGGVLVM